MCNILSGCLCDHEIINSSGLIYITGLSNSWQYFSYEWLLDGSSFAAPQTSANLVIDPTDPNYNSICLGDITLEVTDYFGCNSISNPLNIEPNCVNCLSGQTVFPIFDSICDGESYVFGLNTYSSPGVYIDNFIIHNETTLKHPWSVPAFGRCLFRPTQAMHHTTTNKETKKRTALLLFCVYEPLPPGLFL